MPKLLIALLLTIGYFTGVAQGQNDRPSPPAVTNANLNNKEITINYSQPALKGRDFGSSSFHPFGKVWRNGANEATWIETSDDIEINGSILPKGKYSFFVIPGQDEWTLIFNSVASQWGAYNYDDAKDVLRVQASVVDTEDYIERYTISLDDNGNGSLAWGEVKVAFTVK